MGEAILVRRSVALPATPTCMVSNSISRSTNNNTPETYPFSLESTPTYIKITKNGNCYIWDNGEDVNSISDTEFYVSQGNTVRVMSGIMAAGASIHADIRFDGSTVQLIYSWDKTIGYGLSFELSANYFITGMN